MDGTEETIEWPMQRLYDHPRGDMVRMKGYKGIDAMSKVWDLPDNILVVRCGFGYRIFHRDGREIVNGTEDFRRISAVWVAGPKEQAQNNA